MLCSLNKLDLDTLNVDRIRVFGIANSSFHFFGIKHLQLGFISAELNLNLLAEGL